MFVYMSTRLFHSHFALYSALFLVFIVNISSLLYHLQIHMYMPFVCMCVRLLNCLQRIRLISHGEIISGLSVQLRKAGQQVV